MMPIERLADARWAVVSDLGGGRWRVMLTDEADDEVAALGVGVEGVWDPDVEPHVMFVLAQLGLAPLGSRPWHEDEFGDVRAQVLPL
jgi:hypothetical protein